MGWNFQDRSGPPKVIENDRLQEFWIQTDVMMTANLPHIVVVDKQKKAIVVDAGIPSDSK